MDQCLFTEAIAIYNGVLSKAKDSTAFANRGLCHWELKRYKRALNDYLAAVNLAPRDVIAHRSAGEILNKLGRYVEAAKHLKKAIKLDPTSSRSFCDLGIAYYGLRLWFK